MLRKATHQHPWHWPSHPAHRPFWDHVSLSHSEQSAPLQTLEDDLWLYVSLFFPKLVLVRS